MRIKALWISFFAAWTLFSCASQKTEAAPTSTVPPIPTASLTPTSIPPTEDPHAFLRQEAALFEGPGNVDYKLLGIFKAGEKINPLGFFGDFAKVSVRSNAGEMVGFVRRSAIEADRFLGESLDSEDMPLTPLFDPACSQVKHLYNNDTHTIILDNSKNDNFVDTNGAAILLDSPFQVRVTSMELLGGFGGSLKISGTNGMAGGEEWWRNTVLMDLSIDNSGNYLVQIMDGAREGWAFSMSVPGISASQPIRIAFDQAYGGSFRIYDANRREVERVDLTKLEGVSLPNGLFPDGKMYIGTSMGSHSSLAISGLEVGVSPDGKWTENAQEFPGLAELASRKGIRLGTLFDGMTYQNTRYCRTLDGNFNMVFVGSMDTNWSWKGRRQYDFAGIEEEVNFANRKGWRVRAGVVYGDYDSLPEWLRNGRFSREEYLQILEENVKTIVGHFKGRVQEWMIANEMVNRAYVGNGGDFWYSHIGPEYVEKAFFWAREADPEAVLILNDFDNESPRSPNHRLVILSMLEVVKSLKARGVPIDAVGLQMHLLVPQCRKDLAPKKEDVIAVIRNFADLGVTVSMTEFDVTIYQCPGSREQRLAFQASVYKSMMEACLESGACTDFTTWGVSDANSWLNLVCPESWCINNPGADPLLFDMEYFPKPAYYALREALQ